MPELAKAELHQLDADFNDKINPDKSTKVQFNPDTLKVSFANQIAPPGPGDQNGPQALQFVGAGTTKLAVTLYFDVTAAIPQGLPETDDVRKLTKRVAYFITPAVQENPKRYIPPAVRFSWGSFQFDGIMESLEETLELFSFEGRPLRASMSMTLTQQKITEFKFNDANKAPGATRQSGRAPGTSPMTEAPAGSTLQGLSAAGPSAGNWQAIASSNGIENPRFIKPGQLIDLNPPVNASAGIG